MNIPQPYPWALLVIGLALTALTGCSGDNRQALNGSVSLDGEPVAEGSIVFVPQAEEGIKGSEAIVNGKYAFPAKTGLPPGKYRVEISWFKPTGRQIPSADPGLMSEERREVIPAQFNTNSTLTAEITAAQDAYDFSLKTK